MSGICDTCQRNQVCRRPMDGMDSCRLYMSGKDRNLRERIADLEQLIRDMHRECTACGYSCRTENGECGIIQRIRELGIEV